MAREPGGAEVNRNPGPMLGHGDFATLGRGRTPQNTALQGC